MQIRSTPTSRFNLVVLMAALTLVVAACSGGGGTATTEPSATSGSVTATTPAGPQPSGDTTPSAGTGTGGEGGLETYTMGVFEPTTTDNVWSLLDTSGSDVWNAYPLAPTTDSLYITPAPGFEVMASLAEPGVVPEAVQQGDAWVAEVPLKEGITWSDGEPITAQDFVFTWNVATEFALTANWASFTAPEVVTGLEAVDDSTLRVSFNAQPGLAQWGFGQGVDGMPVMPEHFWGSVAEEARSSDNPSATLLSASGTGAPAAGATVFQELQEGSFVGTTANESFHGTGAEIDSGGVTYSQGPTAQNMTFPFYGGQDAAVIALGEGETDLLLNPLGMQQGLREQVENNPDLTALVNATNGYRYLAFNFTRAPMNDSAFRDALSVLVNKEFVTEQVLQGVAFPLYVLLPEGNANWYNEEVATEIAGQGMAGAEDDARREAAIGILTEAGYIWETAPGWDDPETEDPERAAIFTEGHAFVPGSGLTNPDGTVVEQLNMLTPTASYDPLRAAFGNYISGVALEMGIPIVSVPTEFGQLVDTVFAVDESNAFTLDYDMFILGYTLGSPAFPIFHDAFFGTGQGSNNMGYSSEEFDAAAATFNAARSQEEAFTALWEMERILARDKPHLVLFDTGILEFFNSSRISYPFTETLAGLQFINGAQALVAAS